MCGTRNRRSGQSSNAFRDTPRSHSARSAANCGCRQPSVQCLLAVPRLRPPPQAVHCTDPQIELVPTRAHWGRHFPNNFSNSHPSTASRQFRNIHAPKTSTRRRSTRRPFAGPEDDGEWHATPNLHTG
jgi:hypothetical protein